MKLFTFGYEGLTIDAFIARLQAVKVRTVFDVREAPVSRKPGFSKRAFADALHHSGIVYAHLPALGCPKTIRERYKTNGDWSEYVTAFTAYLATQPDVVAELAALANNSGASCLVCFEADFNRCHRSLVARAAAAAGGPPVAHLTVKTVIPELVLRAVA